MAGKRFLEEVPSRLYRYPGNHTVSEINTFLRLTQNFKMVAKMAGKFFLRKITSTHSADTPRPKNFIKIALSRTISEISIFLRFTQKFKMAAKMAGKRYSRWPPKWQESDFAKSRQYTPQTPCGSKIPSKSFYLALFLR